MKNSSPGTTEKAKDFGLEASGSANYRPKGVSRLSDFGLTVAQCLTIPPLDQAHIVAGAPGINRTMSWVHVVDHSDIEDSLAGNELLLTSGIALASDRALQTEIFEVMNRRNCAGLVVSLGVYLPEIPEAMRVAADKFGIPLIGLPWAVNFGDITRVLLTLLVQSHYQFMERAQRLNRDLLEIVLRRGDLKAVCERMERTIGCSVYLYNEALQPIAASRSRGADTSTLSEANIRAAMAGAVQNAGPLAGDTRTILAKGKPVGIAVPVTVGTRRRGWMILETADRSSDPIYALTTEIGATIAALIITHDDEIERIAQRQNENQLFGLLDGKVSVHSEGAAGIGLHANDPVIVIILDIGSGEPGDALGIARNTLKKYVEHHVLAVRGRSLVGFVQKPRGRQVNWPAKLAEMLAEGGYSPRVGIASEIANHGQIPAEYSTLRDTLKLGHVLRPGDKVLHSEQMAVLAKAMRNLVTGTDLKEVCPSILKLEEHDRSLHGSLITALGCLLDVEGNVSLAARMLGIHRHTMLYRMNRISEILDIELNSTTRLELRLQLIAWQMAGR